MRRPLALLVPCLLAVLRVLACAPETPEQEPGALAAASSEPATLPEGAESLSLLGDTLVAPDLPETVEAERTARYLEAEEVLAADPSNADALIWMGRRTAYLGRYLDAGYGVGAWYLLGGDTAQAQGVLRRVLGGRAPPWPGWRGSPPSWRTPA